MQWKRYKALPPSQKQDESYYIIGLDIGNDSTGIAFYNLAEGEPELIDLSGGYGRPTIPTAMLYMAEQREWVYGEYAVLNRGMGRECFISGLVERLGSSEYIDVDGKPLSVVALLGMYIKELLGNLRHINPKAEIAGIVAAVPSYFSAQAREELVRAFKAAGYEKELIGLVSDRECVFAYHYHKEGGAQTGKGLLIDYGARGVRGGVFAAEAGDVLAIKSLSSRFDDNIGTQAISAEVYQLFADFYAAQTASQPATMPERQLQDQLQTFTYQHQDLLFQKAIRQKPAKLYFNFAYPPFQQTVSAEQADALIAPFRQGFNGFIRQVFEQNLHGEAHITDMDAVICVGGGFEMLWAREAVTALFPQTKLRLYKNVKSVTALGAALWAARELEAATGPAIQLEDSHQLAVDIGLAVGQSLVPLAECNHFWWQQHPPKLIIVNAPVQGEVPLTIVARSPEGEVKKLVSTRLTGLPERPKGTTRLQVGLHFLSHQEARATVSDYGFGELFPKTDYSCEIPVRL